MMNETERLWNGVTIPRLGLGTWCIRAEEVGAAVTAALHMGYRHIDTAQVYGNEHGIGEALHASGIPRDKIFVTTKVAAEAKTYEEAMKAIDGSLTTMGLDYIDLMLIHSPQPWNEVGQSENRDEEGNREAYGALETAYQEGKVRAIGVSNFNRHDIENILQTATVKPMVNQILCHIANTPFELLDYGKEKGIVVEAYSPVAHGEALKIKEIEDVAKKYGVTVPQLCIRYDLQLGTVVLAKAKNPLHIKENRAVDFVISEEDMAHLKKIDRIESYGKYSHYPVYIGQGRI